MEVLVVVLIIGILASIALPQYNQSVARSRFAKLKYVVRGLTDAQEVYYSTFHRYATDFDDLDVSFDNKQLKKCSILGNTSPRAIYCKDDTIHMRYAIFLYNTEYAAAGQQRCSVGQQSTNGVGHRICQRESGLNQPTSINETSTIAHYFW